MRTNLQLQACGSCGTAGVNRVRRHLLHGAGICYMETALTASSTVCRVARNTSCIDLEILAGNN